MNIYQQKSAQRNSKKLSNNAQLPMIMQYKKIQNESTEDSHYSYEDRVNLQEKLLERERTPNHVDIPNMVKAKAGEYTNLSMRNLSKMYNVAKSAQSQVSTIAKGKVNSVLQKKENKTGLPDNLKASVENISGMSMDDVRVHYNSSKPTQLQALAYTKGREIHVAPGQEKHLPHEAWHVVQQAQGRVQPTVQLKDIYANDNSSLEAEADKMGTEIINRRNSPYINNHSQNIDLTSFSSDKKTMQFVKWSKHYRRGKRGQKKLGKDTKYTSSGYEYETDDSGRITNVSGNLRLKPAKRNPYAQRYVGGKFRLNLDDGGHLIASQFDGSGEIDNLVPMNSQINRSGGRWFHMETKWANALKKGQRVSVAISVQYSHNLAKKRRPKRFNVEYTIKDATGAIIKHKFKDIANRPGGR